MLISADTDAFALIDLEAQQTIRRDRVLKRKYIRHLAASPDGTLVVGGMTTYPMMQWDIANQAASELPMNSDDAQQLGVTLYGDPQSISLDRSQLLYLDDHRHKRGWLAKHLVNCNLQSGKLQKMTFEGITPDAGKQAGRVEAGIAGFDFTHAFFAAKDEVVVAVGKWTEVYPSCMILSFDPKTGEMLNHTTPDLRTVVCASAARDAARLVTTHQNENRIRLWDTQALEPVSQFATSGAAIAGLALSRDGTLVASIDQTGGVELWEMKTGKHQTLGSHGAKGLTVLFSQDGSQVVSSAEDQQIKTWEIQVIDWSDPQESEAAAPPNADVLALSNDGEYFATLEQNTVQVWNATTGEGVFEKVVGGACDLEFTAENDLMVASKTTGGRRQVSIQQDLILIDLQEGRSKMISPPEPVPPQMPERMASVMRSPTISNVSTTSLSTSRDGTFAALVRPGYVQRFDWKSPYQKQLPWRSITNANWNSMTGMMATQGFDSASISGDGSILAGTTRDWLLVQRVDTGETLLHTKLPTELGKKTSLHLTPDGSQIVCQRHDWTKVIDVRTGKLLSSIEDTTAANCFANLANLIVVGQKDGQVILVDHANHAQTEIANIGEPVRSLTVSQDGLVAVLSGTGRVFLFEPTTAEKLSQASMQTCSNTNFAPIDTGEIVPRGQTFAEWRENFRTFIRGRDATLQRRVGGKPPAEFRVVRYASDERRLNAWVYRPKSQDGPLPGFVYLHGGFKLDAEDAETVREIANDQFVVLVPAMRGENRAGGDYEAMGGEVDDARAAIRWLADQEWVDPTQVYAFGHSVGGGASALLSLRDDVPVQHTGSCGGLYTETIFDDWIDTLPFNDTPAERKARLLLGNESHMQRPHFAYLGKEDPLRETANVAQEAGKLSLEIVSGDHFTSLEPSLRKYLQMIHKATPAEK